MAESVHIPPFQRTSATSMAGAVDAAPRAPYQIERIYQFVAGRGARGATRAEIEQGLGLRQPTVSGRVNELIRRGRLIVADVPPRRSRITGSKGEVLVAVPPEDAAR